MKGWKSEPRENFSIEIQNDLINIGSKREQREVCANTSDTLFNGDERKKLNDISCWNPKYNITIIVYKFLTEIHMWKVIVYDFPQVSGHFTLDYFLAKVWWALLVWPSDRLWLFHARNSSYSYKLSLNNVLYIFFSLGWEWINIIFNRYNPHLGPLDNFAQDQQKNSIKAALSGLGFFYLDVLFQQWILLIWPDFNKVHSSIFMIEWVSSQCCV